MTTVNPFDLLGDDDAEDPSQLIAAQKAAAAKKETAPAKAKAAAPAAQAKPAKLPSKPLPPSEAVREARTDGIRGGGRGGGRGFGRGRGGDGRGRRDFAYNENASGNAAVTGGEGAPDDGAERRSYGGPRPYRGGRRGGSSNGEAGEGDRPRRHFERHSGTGRGYEMKREGAGRGNWGTQSDELAEVTEEIVTDGGKALGDEKPAGEESGDVKESPTNESEEKEPEEKEMTLEEYEKLLEEKRKALPAFNTTEERKVDAKVFESMQQLSKKKDNDEIFAKLGSDKKKEAAEKEERAKKSVSINEFLKPAEGERHYNSGGRGRGRGGRGSRGFGGGSAASNVAAPKIEDPSHFPTLGAK